MTKQDYELIAKVIRENMNGPDCPVPLRDNLRYEFARALQRTNPRFSTSRFMAACIGEDSHDSAGRKVRYTGIEY